MAAETSRVQDATIARLAELVLGTLSPEEAHATMGEVEASSGLELELAGVRRTVAALDARWPALEPSLRLRERVLALATPSLRFEGFAARVGRLFDLPARRVREILAAIDVPERGWRNPGIPGARFFDLEGGPRVAAADCGLVTLMPGAMIPPHRHQGDEWTLVLQGRAHEDDGEPLEAGDLVHRARGTRHAIIAAGDEPYVFAVVLNGGFHPDASEPGEA